MTEAKKLIYSNYLQGGNVLLEIFGVRKDTTTTADYRVEISWLDSGEYAEFDFRGSMAKAKNKAFDIIKSRNKKGGA